MEDKRSVKGWRPMTGRKTIIWYVEHVLVMHAGNRIFYSEKGPKPKAQSPFSGGEKTRKSGVPHM